MWKYIIALFKRKRFDPKIGYHRNLYDPLDIPLAVITYKGTVLGTYRADNVPEYLTKAPYEITITKLHGSGSLTVLRGSPVSNQTAWQYLESFRRPKGVDLTKTL